MIEALGVENLECRRSWRSIFRGLNFKVDKGGALILRGPNGAGKTTLLRTLAGYLKPAAGRVFVRGGKDETLDPHDAGEFFHFFGHLSGVKAKLTAFENLKFWQHYYAPNDSASDEAVEAALEAFSLLGLADYRAGHLSAGQARRLGLARLLVAKRPIWLLDEPLTSLDAASVKALEARLLEHVLAGGIAVLSTHADLNLAGASILSLPGGTLKARAA